MKASDLLVQCLIAEGVKYVFGMPGEENIDLMDSLSRSPIQFILARHEQGAAFMADVYARITGQPGVCLATLGPGATNLLTGIGSSCLEHSPVVAITGQVATAKLHKEFHQNVNTIQLFQTVTKYNKQILSAQSIPEIVRQGFTSAVSEKPGAVHLQLPEDVARQETSAAPLAIPAKAPVFPEKQALYDAAQLIRNAKRPIILAGPGVIRHGAWDLIRKLAETAHIPLVNTPMAKGLLPFSHPYNLFTVGAGPKPTDLSPLAQADLVIAVGFNPVELDFSRLSTTSPVNMLYIDTTPAQSDSHFMVKLECVGNLQFTLREILKNLEETNPETSLSNGQAEQHAQGQLTQEQRIRKQRVKEQRVKQLETLYSVSSPDEAFAQDIMQVLSDELPETSYVISDVGLHKLWVARWYQPQAPGRTLIFNGFSSMGGALPGAIACCLACPKDSVVIVTGDAGFLMNVQELETARRLGLRFVIILFHDKQLSLIKQHQQEARLRVTGVTFTNPDFALLAKSFYAEHSLIRTADEFEPALKSALKNHGVSLLEVMLHPPSGPLS